MILIRSITIRNYRSIENLSLDLDSHPKTRLVCLVGQNNSGKSNILSAINLLFSRNVPYLDKDDFFQQETSRTISFEAMLWEPIIYKPYSTYPFKVKIYGIRRERKIAVRGKIKGQLFWSHSCLDQSGDVAMRLSRIPQKGKPAQMEKMYEIPDEVWHQISVISLPVDRDLEKHLPPRKSGYLHHVLETTDRAFNDAKRTTTHNGDTKPLSQAFQEEISHVMNLLHISEFATMETLLKHVVEHFFERQLDVRFGDLSSMACFEALVLNFLENDLVIAPDRIGDGARFILLLAIVFCYLRIVNQNRILLVDEPENLLHPHRQRVLRDFLARQLALTNPVFLSTHSPEFLDLTDWKTIVRVYRENSTKIAQISGKYEESLVKHLRRSSDQSVKYAFFSSAVILVEGESEHKAIPIYADRLERNLYLRNITVIFAAGKKNLAILAQMLRSLEIPVVLCYDKDVDNEEENSRIQELFPNDPFFSWTEMDLNYEDEVRKALEISKDEWVLLWESKGKGKVARAVSVSSDDEIPIPDKLVSVISKAWEYAEALS